LNIEKSSEITFFALGTLCKITVIFETKLFGDNKRKKILYIKEALKEASEIVQNIDDKLSVFKSQSEISEVNKNSGKKAIAVSEISFDIIEKSLRFCEMSGGALDISVRPLLELWGFGHKIGMKKVARTLIPTNDEITAIKKIVDYKLVTLDEKLKTIYLEKEGMALDFGALAKGYASDYIANYFIDKKLNNVLIDLGGNILALGKNRKKKDWVIGLQLPWGERGEYFGQIELRDESLVTSGAYERSIFIEGKKYNHTINPRTGFPIDSNITGVSVLCKESFLADALTTMIYVLGAKETIEIINKYYKNEISEIGIIILEDNKKIKITKSLKDRFFVTQKGFDVVYL